MKKEAKVTKALSVRPSVWTEVEKLAAEAGASVSYMAEQLLVLGIREKLSERINTSR